MTKTVTRLIATLAVYWMLPVTAHAMGVTCPPCYRVDDNGGCAKIPGTCSGTTPKCGDIDQQCCGGDNGFCAPGVCMNGMCRGYDEATNYCYEVAAFAESAGGDDPVSCFGSPPCWAAITDYWNYGCQNWCYFSDSRADPVTVWAGPWGCGN